MTLRAELYRSARGGDEPRDLDGIFQARGALDAAGDVDAVGAGGPDGGRDVVGRQASRQQERAPRVLGDQRPGGGDAGTAVAVDECVVEPKRRLPDRGGGERGGVTYPNCANEPSWIELGVVGGRLVAVELHAIEPEKIDLASDLLDRLVHEHADLENPGWDSRQDRRGVARIDVALRPGPEVHADRVGAHLGGHSRVLGCRDAAD